MKKDKEIMSSQGMAICYSGFREGQAPHGAYPGYDEVKEDLLLLHGHWKHLRLYDCDLHSRTVLQVIQQENLDFKVMLGAYIEAEVNNFNCPWNGGVYTSEQLEINARSNRSKMDKLIEMAKQNEGIISSVSVGNEACVEWTDHLVSPSKVIEYARLVKGSVNQPVTYCENYVPWLHDLKELVKELDFISIHTYPVWENKPIGEALEYTKQNYYSVCENNPDKEVVITEAGWTTNSNGRGIRPELVNDEFQKIYFEKLMDWVTKEGILTYYFEAFDEMWKGSPEPLEPEKHWGLFRSNRTSKPAVKKLVAN